MIKETLYYKNNYLSEFETKVKECIEENGKFKIILEETAFYPEGGGQPADTGFIDDIKVIDVQEKNNIIYHIVEDSIEVSKCVKCKIDFEKRLNNMQSHTAEHIVSGLICKIFNTSNVGFHIGKDFVTMDFNVSISEEDLREVEKNANFAVYRNLPIIVKIYSKEDVKNLEYRSKKELNEDIRIVEIPGYDKCACCGIHVTRTGEIGIIKLLKVEKYKAGSRIYMLVGNKAIEDYTDKYNQINSISTLLSLKLEEVYSGVVNLTEEIELLKKEKSELKAIVIENEISNIPNSKNIIIQKENMDMNDMKNYCNKLKNKSESIAGIVSNGKFIFMSDTINLKDVLAKLKENIDIKGGGNNSSIQGQTSCSFDKIKEIIENF